MTDAFEVRPATADDTSAILELLGSSLGWNDDRSFADFYAWKHDANPFGPSARWVAVEAGRIIGFRAFLRWELEQEDRVLRAVRAVDTATAPDVRGRGVFRRLTLHALEELGRAGVDLVFNTPNDQSGQGYLTMGWHDVGRVPLRIRPRSIGGALRLLTSRGGASSRWSEPSTVGVPATDVLADPSPIDAILRTRPPASTLRTACSIAYLRWRYGGFIAARAVAHPEGFDHGIAFVRVRQRGGARVAVLGDVLVPNADPALERAVVRRVVTTVDADGTAALGRMARQGSGFLPFGGAGPRLVARSLGSDAPASLAAWDLGYGDLELL